jgi:regulator of sigma E protease
MHIFLEIITFLVVIIVLILVHELGHFIVAKLSGMRVDEFGIGYPPRALTLGKIGDTEYTLNWLPFGGFVRIYGEDGTEEGGDNRGAFNAKPRILQALTLVAGIVMNLIFAYILITATLIMGTQQIIPHSEEASSTSPTIMFAAITPGGPADAAGFQAGDFIKKATIITKTEGIGYSGTDPEGLFALIGIDSTLSPIQFSVDRNGKMLTLTATPKLKVIAGAASRPGIGVEIVEVGVIKTPWKQAPLLGLQETWNLTTETTTGLYNFFKDIVLFKANLSQVSGPIGIASDVGQASANGLAALLGLTALISVNLALINLIPIPALDGGRLLFVIIEAIIGRPLNPKIAERVNAVGFALLILLMVVVSAHDIYTLIK